MHLGRAQIKNLGLKAGRAPEFAVCLDWGRASGLGSRISEIGWVDDEGDFGVRWQSGAATPLSNVAGFAKAGASSRTPQAEAGCQFDAFIYFWRLP